MRTRLSGYVSFVAPGQVNQRQVDESNRAWVTTSPVEIALRQICDAIHQQKPEQQGGVSILSSHCTTGVIVYVKPQMSGSAQYENPRERVQ